MEIYVLKPKAHAFPTDDKRSSHESNSCLAAFVVLEAQSEHIGSILPRDVPGLKPLGTAMLRSSKFDGKM